jgi:hypothetical protein
LAGREAPGGDGQWSEELVQAGARLEAGRLQPSSKGVRVRCSGRTVTVIDGPFAETKELIAGFWAPPPCARLTLFGR